MSSFNQLNPIKRFQQYLSRMRFLVTMLLLCLPYLSLAQRVELTPLEKESFREDATQMISFVEFLFNTLADENVSTRQKNTIINESYTKVFRDAEVQVEDDLTQREVATNKNIQDYLRDIDFFFTDATYELEVLNTRYDVNEKGENFLLVSTQRTLEGLTSDGDSVNSVLNRYFEINIDAEKQELKIASIYSTSANYEAELKTWWASLPPVWQSFFRDRFKAYNSELPVEVLTNMVDQQEISLQEYPRIQNLAPLSKLRRLKTLDISNTNVSSLAPLSGLTRLTRINLTNTPVNTLSALSGNRQMKEIIASQTDIQSLQWLQAFPGLEKLVINGTAISSLADIQYVPELADLQCSNTRIKFLAGLEKATQLTSLDISQTPVNQVIIVKYLPKLQLINLENTAVSNLSPLTEVPSLKIIRATSTPVKSIAPLKALPDLLKVYCDNTLVPEEEARNFALDKPDVLVIYESQALMRWYTALSPMWKSIINSKINIRGKVNKESLAAIASITELDLSGNTDILNLEPVSRLLNLQKLTVTNTNIRELDPLIRLVKLQQLDISNTPVSSLAPLKKSTNLQRLNLSSTPVNNLQALYELNKLEYINCEQTGISETRILQFLDHNPNCLVVYKTNDLILWWNELPSDWQDAFSSTLTGKFPDPEDLHRVVQRQSLDISNRKLNNLNPINAFIRLKELSVENCQLTNLEGIEGLSTLEEINISRNPINDLKPLQSQENLKTLNCSDTPVEDLDPLAALGYMNKIDCSGTLVRSLRPINGLFNLESLYIHNTDVRRLRHIERLYRLRILSCYNTRISERQVEKFKEAVPECEVTWY